MKVEKLDRVAMNVEDLDKAIAFFSDLLGITFDKLPSPPGMKSQVAISPSGLELLEMGLEALEDQTPIQKEGVYCFHFKVDNLEQAKEEMKKKGVRLIRDITLGTLKEAVFSRDDLHGAVIVLVEYTKPKVIEAILERA